ncbi:MAG: hypothetical protein QW820_07565 [Sulfolobales archaeon]
MGSFSTVRAIPKVEIKDVWYSTPSNFATVLQYITSAEGASRIATFLELYDYLVKVLNSYELSVDKLAQIFNEPSLPASYCVKLITHPNMSFQRVIDMLYNPYLSADKEQSILYALVDSGYYGLLLDILTYNAPSYTIRYNTTWTSGVNIVKNLTLQANLTLSTGPAVIIADTISSTGSIYSGWIKGSGGTPGAPGAGRGGDGRGGIIILAKTITTLGYVYCIGGNGGSASTVSASGGGGNGGGGLFYEVSGYPAGIGGNGGGTVGPGSKNGGGGGGMSYAPGGSGGVASVVTFNTLKDLVVELLKMACDWWLINVVGKTPTTYKTFPLLGGSGGGGGGARVGSMASGGGGGGGGQIVVFAINMGSAVLYAMGGRGGNGGYEGAVDCGGGGGGGGLVYVAYKTLSGTITADVSGRGGGSGDYGYSGASGTSGSVLTSAI